MQNPDWDFLNYFRINITAATKERNPVPEVVCRNLL